MRDAFYEREFFERLAREAEVNGGAASARATIAQAISRLEAGRDKYGDDDFVQKDLIKRANEHAADMVAYAMLESRKRLMEQREGGHYLFSAALHSVIADYYIRLSLQHN